MKEDRKLHIDLLRIVACISVIMLHSASQYWYEFPVTDSRWMVYNTWDAISRFGVPVFVMISGALFLSREGEVNLRKLYCSNIFRLVAAYAVWSIVYGLWDCRNWTWGPDVTVWDYVMECVLGRYHLWFLPMLVGIYMLLPVIKTFTDHCSKRTLEYFLLLFVIVQIGKSTLGIIQLPTIANVLVQLLDVEMVCSYVGYFVLGYYLYHYGLVHVWQVRIYFLGAVSLVLAALISNRVSGYYMAPKAEAFDSYSVFTFLVTVAVFVFFQEKLSGIRFKKMTQKLLLELSANTFGVYLIHLLVIEGLQTKGIDSLSIGGAVLGETPAGCLVGIPLLTIASFLICNVAVSLLRRIPVVGKYIF